jgi:predicted secreted hydrolase
VSVAEAYIPKVGAVARPNGAAKGTATSTASAGEPQRSALDQLGKAKVPPKPYGAARAPWQWRGSGDGLTRRSV